MSRVILNVLVCLSFISTCLSATSAEVVEKQFAFPPPVQWKSGNWEVSLIGLAWGPANSPEMISKGHEERATDAPVFFQDRPYALAIKLRGFAPNTSWNVMAGGSGLVLIKDVSGDFQIPLELTPTGFVHYSGSPGVMDMSFNRTNTIEFWDFFPVAPRQKEFLFQSFAFTPMQSGRGSPKASFKVLIRNNGLVLMNAIPGSRESCADFTRNFSGTIGSSVAVSMRLTALGAKLSGTEQYVRIGKTLWLAGHVDSFGNFVLNEQYPKDHVTGIFKGTFSRGCQSVSGYFSKPDGSELLPFEFQQDSNTTK